MSTSTKKARPAPPTTPYTSNSLWHASGNHTLSLGCQTCFFRPDCGGLEVGADVYDCLDFCRCEDRAACDNVCQRHPELFVPRLREVGGLKLDNVPSAQAIPSMTLPRHIPCVYHGSRRILPLESSTVAIPLARLIDFGAGAAKFQSREELLSEFMLADSCQIIATGTDRDHNLEKWWRIADRRPVVQSLMRLGVIAATAPNYSVFDDVPRLDNLFNIKRIALMTAEIHNEGLPCALHLNARTDHDWNRWIEYLNARPEISFVAVEFGTGAGYERRIDWHVNQMVRLAQQVRRPLGLIVRGGVHVLHRLTPAFESVSLIDTRPFSKASRRQKAVIVDGRLRWQRCPTPEGAPIDQLLRENIDVAGASLPLIPKNIATADKLMSTYAPSGAANDAGHESSQLSLLDQLSLKQ